MYKLIVVDDEDIVRRSIVMRINWEEIGFETPHQAVNGLEALEIAREVKPDLVFADIKMPIMDGLELAAALKEELPDTHVVIFSGHDEFKYAQESITLGVLDYILKPLGSATLTKKFKEVKKKLDTKAEGKAYIDKMKAQLQKSLPLLKESFLSGLVCSQNHDLYNRNRMLSLDLDLGQGPYIISVIEPEYRDQELDLIDVYTFGMKNIVKESVGQDHPCFTDPTGRVVILFRQDVDSHIIDREVLLETLNVIQKAIQLHLKLSTTISIGKKASNLRQLSQSYSEAITALDCKYTVGTNHTFDFMDQQSIKEEFYYPSELSNQFIKAVKGNNRNDIKAVLDQLTEHIGSTNGLSLANLKFIFIQLVTELTKLLAELKNSPQQLWSRNLKLYSVIEEYRSIDDVLYHLESVAVEIAASLTDVSMSSRKSLVVKAVEYVKANYKEPTLSLKETADHIAVSSGYLSAIFKKENDVNFNAYLTGLRMDEAKRLLSTTDMNIYDIAYETGHANPHYFSISFKKSTGQSPSDYRNYVQNQ